MKKFLSVMFAGLMAFSVAACGGNGGGGSDTTYDITQNTHESENFVNFTSTDKSFDSFINDYLHRHLRYDEQRIGDLSLGDSVMFNKEWESLALMWFDSTSKNGNVPDDRFEKIKYWISSVTVDKFGYVWAVAGQALDGADSQDGVFFHQGWPFPSYSSNGNNGTGYEFTRGVDGWTTNAVTSRVDGLWRTTYKGSGEAVYTSPEGMRADTLKSPFLEVDIRISDQEGFGAASSVEDIVVRYRTDKDAPAASGTERTQKEYYPHEVKQSEFATIPAETIPSDLKKHFYFPMYLDDSWGWDNGTFITDLQIAVVPKSGKEMNISCDFNYVRFQFDTRQSNNATLMLTAAQNYQMFTGDLETLKNNLPRYRSAMQFMLGALGGKQNKLIDVSYMAGHDGVLLDKNGRRIVGHGIGNGYWDILAFPGVDFYSNLYFYKALSAMQYLEKIAEANGIEAEKPEVACGANDGTTERYTETAASLSALMAEVKAKITEYFWNEETGRFHMGYRSTDTAHAEPLDYGYVIFNQEAIVAGLTTDAQAKSIMDWVSGKRIVEGDTSTGADIYKYEFAPRVSTKRNDIDYFWGWGLTTPFGQQVQDGGAILYCSFYDILSRVKVYGADDAYARFGEIRAWYEKVAKEGGEGTQFYRAYYDWVSMEDPDFSLQGGGTAGGLGLDNEFLENAILYAAIPYGFFGLDSQEHGTLTVRPRISSKLGYMEIENLMFDGARYDLRVTNNSVELWTVRGANASMKLTAKFEKPSGSYTVTINNQIAEKDKDYIEEDGFVLVTVPFRQVNVTIK